MARSVPHLVVWATPMNNIVCLYLLAMYVMLLLRLLAAAAYTLSANIYVVETVGNLISIYVLCGMIRFSCRLFACLLAGLCNENLAQHSPQ